jgi:hypothetical protein
MIRYALVCDAGHEFESWFRSGDDYDRQHAERLVACPRCGSTQVEKQVMRPSVARRDRDEARRTAPLSVASPQEQELRRKLRELREHVTKNADYVGDRFPELARQMHHEETERRSIYGEARPDEVRGLLDDGVEVHPLPVLPEDRN